EQSSGNEPCVPGRNVPYRRRRLSRCRRLFLHSRPPEGHDRHGRRKRLLRRGRSRHLPASGGSRSGGLRHPRPAMGRARRGLHCAEAGTSSWRGRTDRPLPAVSRQLQDSSPRRVLGDRAAQERLGQDPEEDPAGTFLGRSETGGGLMWWPRAWRMLPAIEELEAERDEILLGLIELRTKLAAHTIAA